MVQRQNRDKDTLFPSHVCPYCGEWWDVDKSGVDTWSVVEHNGTDPIMAGAWTEVMTDPVCPLDAHGLNEWLIVDL